MRTKLRIDLWKALWTIGMVSFFAGVVTSVFTGEDGAIISADAAEGAEVSHDSAATKHADDTKSEPVIRRTAEGCLADAATLEDLKRQKRELEHRNRDLQAREAEIKARELALADELRRLGEARDEISKLDTDRRKESEAKVAKLVETIEGMNPKAASALIASIDETLAVQSMARLTTVKLSKIMNVMDPARSTKLSELLAGVTRARNAKPASISQDDAAAVTGNPRKGGEKNDGKSHEQQSDLRSTRS